MGLTLETIPIELLLLVVSYLDSISLLYLLQSSRQLNALSDMLECYAPVADVLHKEKLIHFTQNSTQQVKGVLIKSDRCLRSTLPIFKHHLVSLGHDIIGQCWYFEVSILSCHSNAHLRLGLVGPKWDGHRPPGSMPDSVGYINTDGHISVGTGNDDRYMFGPSWQAGDTVGCGVLTNGLIFFTLNGRWIAEAPHKVSTIPLDYRKLWFPAFSSSAPATIQFHKRDFQYRLLENHIAPFMVERLVVPQLDICDFNLQVVSPSKNSLVPQIQENLIKFPRGLTTGVSVQSNIPITLCQRSRDALLKGFFYFEVTIEVAPDRPNSFLSVGLASKPYPFHHHIGWNKESVGYHSDDGCIFASSYIGIEKLTAGYGQGSIIGCGYEPVSKLAFFTHDGIRLDYRINVEGILYPSVAANSDWQVSLNIGRDPFFYAV